MQSGLNTLPLETDVLRRAPLRRPLRMLILSSDTYPPQRADVKVLFGEELAGRGHRIDWILQSERDCAQAYVAQWGGGRVWVGATDLGQSLPARVRKHLKGIRHDLRVFPLLGCGNYDFVEVKDKFISGVLAAVAARMFRTRFVYWLSWPFPEEYLIRARGGTARYPLLAWLRGLGFHFLLYRIILRVADHVFVQSEQMRSDIAARGISPAKMTVVPMGIGANLCASATRPEGRTVIPAGERCFLYLGTLSKVRQLDFLIRVLALIRKDLPDVRLYIVGRGEDPSDEHLLIAEAQRMNVLPALVMVGQLPQPEALRYVREANVCVSPFYPTPILNSTSPTKLVEYMAMGKAVVANDHPEQRLVIEESGAGYCVPWQEDAFAQAILSLLQAPELARAMGERGRRYAIERRSYPMIADLVEQELWSVVRA